MRYVQNLHLLTLNIEQNYYKYVEQAFYGSNLWDLYSKEFMSLGKTCKVAIRKVYNVPFQTHCRFLRHVSQLNHVTQMLKSRFIMFMVANLVGKIISMLLMLLIFILEMQCPVLVGILI